MHFGNMNAMELRTLQYFIAVAEKLSFSLAAEKLGVSQSAVSRQVHLLEEELRLRLFDRVGRKVFLTPAGRDLLERTYEVHKSVDSLASRAGELAAGNHGTLRIGATPQTLESLVAEVLPRFVKKHPEVRIELLEDGSAGLARAVERGSIDVAMGALARTEGLETKQLFPLVVLVALPRDHRLRDRKTVEVEDLADESMLLLREEFMTRELFDGACQVAHVAPRILLESGSPHCLLALVESGLGVAVVPSTVRFAKGHPRVVPLAQNGRALGLWMQVLWDPRRYTSPPVHNFIAVVSEHTKADYPGKSFGVGNLLSHPRARKRVG